MRILIFNGYNVTPHLETEMEIALDYINKGHEVFFVHCKGELATCYGNPEHKKWICNICSSKRAMALKTISLPKENILSMPAVSVDEKSLPEEFGSLAELKSFTYDGVDIGMGVASSLISKVRDHLPSTTQYRSDIYIGVKTAVYAYKAAKVLLEQVQPDEVILFNGRLLEIRPILRLCENKGIKYYTHERGGLMNTYLLRANDIPHSLKAADREMRELWQHAGIDKEDAGAKFFIDRRNRVIQSWYVFTGKQEKGLLPEGFNDSKKNIVLFNSSMDEYEGIAGFTSKIYQNDNIGIRKILESFSDLPDYHFYLRIHPNLSGLDNTQMRELKEIQSAFESITVIGPTEQIDTYALVDAADIVAVFGSTVGAEAAYWDKPVILLGNAFYATLDGFYKPATHEEVIALMKDKLISFNNRDILQYGYWELNKGIKYHHYQPQSLTVGTFNGKEISISKFRKILYYCWGKITS